ncbi:flagellar filament capping protein FliD [bacterium]|nr:flagellar filament capping protein FliD [bacterium]
MAGTAQVTGLASGIDWETTIAQLMSIEQRPVTLLQGRKQELQQKLSLWASLQAKVLGLQSACEGMDTRAEFAVKSVNSSDSSIVSVTAEAGAEPGNHSIRVLGLARSHKIAGQGWADKNSTGVGDSGGDLVIGVGDETVTIDDGDLSASTTLEQLRDLINNNPDNDGLVTATILNDGSSTDPYRLVLTADSTGTENTISISSNPTNLNFATSAIDDVELATGWSGTSTPAVGGSASYTGSTNKTFTFTVSGSGTQTIATDSIDIDWVDSEGNSGTINVHNGYGGEEITVAEGVTLTFDAGTLEGGETFSLDVFHPSLVSAQDAEIQIDGIYMTKSSNTITDVLTGVTLSLLSADDTETVDITISNDTAGVKAKVQAFVDAYNTLIGEVATYSSYDEENEVAAPLLGDGNLSSLRSDFGSIIAGGIPGLPDEALLTTLAQLGIKSGANGLLTIDDSKLTDAIDERFDDVVDLFCESFTSNDSKVFFQSRTEATQGGTYTVDFTYDADGNITSAQINGIDATIEGMFIVGAENTAMEGMRLGFTYTGTGAGSVSTTVRLGLGAAALAGNQAILTMAEDTGDAYFAEDALNKSIESIDRQIESWETRLEQTEERLRRQFTQLEVTLAQLQSQSSYLSSVL